MNAQEIEIDEICQLIKISHSYFSQKNRRGKWGFPKPIKIIGRTGSKYVYDRKEVMDWWNNYSLEKVLRKKTDTNKLMVAFNTAKFDRSGLKDVYRLKAIRAKINKPITKKIHVEQNYDAINFSCMYWKGLI